MSDPKSQADGTRDAATRTDPARDDPSITAAPTLVKGWLAVVLPTSQARVTQATVIKVATIAAIVAIMGSGVFAAHQLLTYGSLVPSIAGGWYGPFAVARADTGQYSTVYSIYASFSVRGGNALTATTASCTVGASTYTQPPTAGLTFTGTTDGTHFRLSAGAGDVESGLIWVGTYSIDRIHIDFYPDGTPVARSPYANLRRGSYDDFLATCKAK